MFYLTHQEANNEGAAKEASATRVISQPQTLDKLKDAQSPLDDIQKGQNDALDEKSLPILYKVNSSFHLSMTCLGRKIYVYICIYNIYNVCL